MFSIGTQWFVFINSFLNIIFSFKSFKITLKLTHWILSYFCKKHCKEKHSMKTGILCYNVEYSFLHNKNRGQINKKFLVCLYTKLSYFKLCKHRILKHSLFSLACNPGDGPASFAMAVTVHLNIRQRYL
jgi:hypothetical protein